LPRPEPAPGVEKNERLVVMPQPGAVLNTPESEPEPRPPVVPDESRVNNNTPGALVLGSARGFGENDMKQIRAGLEQQFGIHVAATVGIHFDFDADQDQIAAQVKDLGRGPLIVLQEVWQPPIRGLLYYFVQIRQIFSDSPLWIVMIQTMDQGEKNVAPSDVNFQVWKSAVNQLNDPQILIERWVSL